jgi:hypothetical protein
MKCVHVVDHHALATGYIHEIAPIHQIDVAITNLAAWPKSLGRLGGLVISSIHAP